MFSFEKNLLSLFYFCMLKKIDLQVINHSTTNLLSAHIILIVINHAKYFHICKNVT